MKCIEYLGNSLLWNFMQVASMMESLPLLKPPPLSPLSTSVMIMYFSSDHERPFRDTSQQLVPPISYFSLCLKLAADLVSAPTITLKLP